ncbi:MAG: CpaF family protein [Actinobacteria bacterium]|nr:CpaF family protein [Actinomycetota bacterium]
MSVSGLEQATRLVQERVLRDYPGLVSGARTDQEKREHLLLAISRILVEEEIASARVARDRLAQAVASELIGLGPLDPLMDDLEVTDVMVNGPFEIFVERRGRLEPVSQRFRSDEHLLETIRRIVAPLGRRIDQSTPLVDGRLPDGSRVNAVIPPLSLRGPVLTVRKFRRHLLKLQDLRRMGTLSEEMATFLSGAVRARLNVIISGGTGSGKTTTLNALLREIPEGSERLVIIEDAAELQPPGSNAVVLESRPPNLEGQGEITIRHLLRNALRMRPDRIVIGESRGKEAFDLLTAMNTGHEGSLSTIHANGPRDALHRLENMVLMADEDLPHQAVREQVRSAVDLVVHQARMADGVRRILEISLVNKDPAAAEPVSAVFRCQHEGTAGLQLRFSRLLTDFPDFLRDRWEQAGLPPAWAGKGGD